MSISKERAELLCSILRGLAEGKTIQANLMGKWHDRTGYPQDMTTFYMGVDYRIKPEPRKTYYRLWEDQDGCLHTLDADNDDVYSRRERCQADWVRDTANALCVRFKRWIGDWQEHVVQED